MKGKKGKRKVQGVSQSQTAALPRIYMETKGSGTYCVQNLYIVMYKCKFIHDIYKVMYTYPELQYSNPPSYYLGTGSRVGIFFLSFQEFICHYELQRNRLVFLKHLIMNYSVIGCTEIFYYELQRNRLGFLKHFIMNYSVICLPVLKYI